MKMIIGKINFSLMLSGIISKKIPALIIASCLTPAMFISAEASLRSTINFQQADIRVTGKVTDASSGETLPGVTIKVKGLATGVATDVNGNYTINAPANGVLVVTYLGYTAQEVSVNNRTQIDIALQESVSSLDEVIVTGYGTQTKSDLTGSISSESKSST